MFPRFHASRMRRTVWKDLEIMGARPTRTIEPLRYCGIKVNGSKEKLSRFLQVQLINVWLIRYNHCV